MLRSQQGMTRESTMVIWIMTLAVMVAWAFMLYTTRAAYQAQVKQAAPVVEQESTGAAGGRVSGGKLSL
jgi:hypothetical protein